MLKPAEIIYNWSVLQANFLFMKGNALYVQLQINDIPPLAKDFRLQFFS